MIDTYAENHASETGTIGDHVTIINTEQLKMSVSEVIVPSTELHDWKTDLSTVTNTIPS